MTSTLGVIFEDFHMCVSLTCKDKLQDNYSIFNEFLMNCTQIVSFKFQENGQRLSSERVKRGFFYLLDYVTPTEIFQIGDHKKKKLFTVTFI